MKQFCQGGCMEQKQKKDNKKFYNTMRLIGNIIFVPIVAFVLVVSIILFAAKRNNEVPSLFGYSVVKIISGSMRLDRTTGEERPQFAQGKCVIVKVVDTKSLNIGDVIAFYDYMDTDVDSSQLSSNKQTTPNSSSSSNINTSIAGGARNKNQERVAPYSKVIFHRIIDILTPINETDENYGKLFFQTKGDANESADSNWIMEDYVVGKYESSNAFICGIFSFCTSKVGSIVLIVIPSLIMIALLAISMRGEVKEYQMQKKGSKKTVQTDEDILDKLTKDENSVKTEQETKEEQRKREEKERILQEILQDAKKSGNDKKPPPIPKK